jgi:hypothetical protein
VPHPCQNTARFTPVRARRAVSASSAVTGDISWNGPTLRVRPSEHRGNPVEAVEHDRSEAAIRCPYQIARRRQRQTRRIEPPVLGDLTQRRHNPRIQHAAAVRKREA